MKRVFLVMITLAISLSAEESDKAWAVYYSDKAPIKAFDPYDLIVLDSDYHPSIASLKERNKLLLGYISLGEVEDHREWYKEVKKEGILREENEHWKGSYFVDLRDTRWTKRVIEELIPSILNQQFDGIFIDTMDNAEFMEKQDPKKYKGMQKAGVELLKSIRFHFPGIKIMLNRAYTLLPDVVDHIDMELGESIYADYNFEADDYQLVEKDMYEQQKQLLQSAKQLNPKLKIYTLDYWNPADEGVVREIYEEERGNGFIPYVSTIELDQLFVEPKPS